MITYKKLLENINEVAEPKPGVEKEFKAKHKVKKRDHPEADEDQFKGGTTKDKSRKADKEGMKEEELEFDDDGDLDEQEDN